MQICTEFMFNVINIKVSFKSFKKAEGRGEKVQIAGRAALLDRKASTPKAVPLALWRVHYVLGADVCRCQPQQRCPCWYGHGMHTFRQFSSDTSPVDLSIWLLRPVCATHRFAQHTPRIVVECRVLQRVDAHSLVRCFDHPYRVVGALRCSGVSAPWRTTAHILKARPVDVPPDAQQAGGVSCTLRRACLRGHRACPAYRAYAHGLVGAQRRGETDKR